MKCNKKKYCLKQHEYVQVHPNFSAFLKIIEKIFAFECLAEQGFQELLHLVTASLQLGHEDRPRTAVKLFRVSSGS